MWSPSSQHQHSCPRGEQYWSSREPIRLSAHARTWAASGQPQTEVWVASNVSPVQAPAMAAPPASESPFPSQPITPPATATPVLLWIRAARQARPAWALAMYQGRLWRSNQHQISGRTLKCHLCKHQQWLPLLCSDATLGLSRPCIPWPRSLPSHGSSHSSADL